MKRLMLLFLGLCVLGAASTSSPAASYSDYFLYQQWGGTWQDVNKSPANPDDDLMCWAATASNLLSWGNWGTPAYNYTGNIFQHILDHWTDNAGYANWAWRWWFNGAPPPYSTIN